MLRSCNSDLKADGPRVMMLNLKKNHMKLLEKWVETAVDALQAVISATLLILIAFNLH